MMEHKRPGSAAIQFSTTLVVLRHWTILLTTFMSFCLQSGCGEDEQQSSVKSNGQSEVKSTKPLNEKKTKRASRKTARRKKKSRTQKFGLEVSTDSSDIFDIAGNVTHWDLHDHRELESGDEFSVRLPQQGLDSGDFTIVKLGRSGTDYEVRYQPPRGFSVVWDAGASPEGYPLRIICKRDKALMAFVPEGVFICGKTDGPSHTGPEHGVYLNPYYIDVYEVNFEQYEKFRESQRSAKKRLPSALSGSNQPGFPAIWVSWRDAKDYCRWARKSLPTEAEWEKAGRGNDGFDYPWGNDKPLWHRPRRPGQIDQSGAFRGDTSPLGVMDMAGNAREWCVDWYSATEYADALSRRETTLRNPQGPRLPGRGKTPAKVVKGGVTDWYLWNRTGLSLAQQPQDIGFRCVLRISSEDWTFTRN